MRWDGMIFLFISHAATIGIYRKYPMSMPYSGEDAELLAQCYP